MADVLLQTTLPATVAKWAKGVAAREGLSVAAWLRRVVMLQQQQAVVAAWIHGPNDSKQNLHLHRDRRTPTFLLERGDTHPDGAIDFRTMRPDGKAFTSKELAAFDGDLLRYNLAVGWLNLDGSMTPWMMVHSMADSNAAGQVILRLRPIVHPARTFDVTPSYWRGLPPDDARRVKAGNVLGRMLPPNVPHSTRDNTVELKFMLPEGHPMTDAEAMALQESVRSSLESR